LVLTDMVMPRMSGRFFADWLRKASPETKVVFVSGYLEESLHPGDRLDNGMFFLPKPFDPEQLAKTVRQVLDS
jgi:CheY-like chemotaxis protein